MAGYTEDLAREAEGPLSITASASFERSPVCLNGSDTLSNDQVRAAADFLRGLSSSSRLRLLCAMLHGEKTVGELTELLALQQPRISYELKWLCSEKLVSQRRDGKYVYSFIADERVRRVIALLDDMFCRS